MGVDPDRGEGREILIAFMNERTMEEDRERGIGMGGNENEVTMKEEEGEKMQEIKGEVDAMMPTPKVEIMMEEEGDERQEIRMEEEDGVFLTPKVEIKVEKEEGVEKQEEEEEIKMEVESNTPAGGGKESRVEETKTEDAPVDMKMVTESMEEMKKMNYVPPKSRPSLNSQDVTSSVPDQDADKKVRCKLTLLNFRH